MFACREKSTGRFVYFWYDGCGGFHYETTDRLHKAHCEYSKKTVNDEMWNLPRYGLDYEIIKVKVKYKIK